jgi:hypothetical protein
MIYLLLTLGQIPVLAGISLKLNAIELYFGFV